MTRISSVGIGRSHIRLVGGILCGAGIVVVLLSLISLRGWELVLGLAIAVVCFVSCIPLWLVKATIDVNSAELVVGLRPFYSKQLSLDKIESVSVGRDTSLLEGFGYRILGKHKRGLLLGGPSIAIHTGPKTWFISTDDPAQTKKLLERQLAQAH